jgi:hypothetical protein
MKASECKAEIFIKNGENYTRFFIGKEVIVLDPERLEQLLLEFGGKLIKQTKVFKYYEIKGNQIKLMALH